MQGNSLLDSFLEVLQPMTAMATIAKYRVRPAEAGAGAEIGGQLAI